MVFVNIVRTFSEKQECDRIFSIFWREWGSKWGSRWGQGLVSRRRTTPDPIETPMDPHNPQKVEKIRSHSWFEKIRTMLTQIFLQREPISAQFSYFVHIQGWRTRGSGEGGSDPLELGIYIETILEISFYIIFRPPRQNTFRGELQLWNAPPVPRSLSNSI